MSEKEEKKVQDAVEKTAEEKAENFENAVKQAEPEKKEKKPSNVLLFFQKTVEAIKNAVKNNYWKSGLVFILVYLLIAGVVSSLQFVQVKLASYDVSIEYAKERLEAAEDNYRQHQTTYYQAQVENYKEMLSDARNNKWKNFMDPDFYLDIAKNFGISISGYAIRFLLLIVVLFVMGKVLNGQGKFSQVVAGVGLSVNVYYLSLVVLPLLAKIPYLSSIAALTGVVGSLFFLLTYFVFKNTFEFEENKSVLAVFASMLITVFLTNLILYSDVWTAGITNNLLQ